jgi:hypothetical protein
VHDDMDLGVGACASYVPRHHLDVVHDGCGGGGKCW